MTIEPKLMDPDLLAYLQGSRPTTPPGHGMLHIEHGHLQALIAHAKHWELAAKNWRAKAEEKSRLLAIELELADRSTEIISGLVDRNRRRKAADRAEIEKFRDRCPVEASDVKEAGVTDVHLVRWLHTKSWHRSGAEKTTRFGALDGRASTLTTWRAVPRTRAGVSVPDTNAPADIAEAIRTMAHHLDMDRWDILAEMAAMDPS